MKKYTLGFIGTGNMGGALVRAACKNAETAKSTIIYNRSPEKALALASQCGCDTAENACAAAANAKFVVIGVKPVGVPALLAEISDALKESGAILVSMAAGIDLAALHAMTDVPCIRIMPNTPCACGEGLTLVCPDEKADGDAVNEFISLLAPAGRFERTPESLFDAAGTVSGCGPAWAYMFIEALADGAVACGVPRRDALVYAAQMLRGAATLALESGAHPSALKDAVCSPGGSTIEGVAALEDGAFRADVIRAVKASYEKTLKMGKK